MIIMALLLAQAAAPDWWSKYPIVEPNYFDRFDPPAPRGPAMLVIATPQAIKTVPYKTMQACERARRYAQPLHTGDHLPNGALVGPPLVTYNCVPR